MELSERQLAFLEEHQQAAMITTGRDGLPKVARVGVLMIDGKLWSSGTEGRVRTKRLRGDPRCTLFVFEGGFMWLGLEATVRILDGPDAPQLHVRMFRQMQNRPQGDLSWFGRELNEDEFVQVMKDEGRLIYEFDVTRAYGMA